MKRLIPILLLLLAAPAWSANCYVEEFANLVQDGAGRIVPVAGQPTLGPPLVVDFSSGEAASDAFNPQTRFVRVMCDANAHYSFGADPEAATSDSLIGAYSPEYFGVGAGLKVSFVGES